MQNQNKRKNTALTAAAGLLSYIGCVCITIAVAYFIDGTAGIILTAALIIGFAISLALTLTVMRSITVEATVDKAFLSKNETAVLSVRLSKRIILPAPIIEIRPNVSPHLALCGAELYKGTVAGLETTVLEIPVRALHFGEAYISLCEISLSDYLGIFTFRLKNIETNDIKLAVYPDIPDAAVQTNFLKTAAQLNGADDEEEATDEIAAGGTGMPGYEHRQYILGDPLKKINWKLSSKRDIYMIRLDEKTASTGQLFFLDTSASADTDTDDELRLTVRDNVTEGLLAIFAMMTRENKEAAFYRFSDGLWLKSEIKTMQDVYTLQEQLASLKDEKPVTPVPPDAASSNKTPICFTASFRGNEAQTAEIVRSFPELLMICSEASQLKPICKNFWTVNGDFEFRRTNS